MKRNIILSIFILLLGFLMLGCGIAKNEIKIKTDVKIYSPLMSSVFGIGMIPELITIQKGTKVEYHWSTTSGWFYFLEGKKKKQVINAGEKLIWIPEFQEVSSKTKNSIVTLKAIDANTGKMLDETNLTIEKNGVYYIVKPNGSVNGVEKNYNEKQFLSVLTSEGIRWNWAVFS